MFSFASTQRVRNSTDSSESVPRSTMSSSVRRRLENFRIVRSGPESESGGMTTFTRLPSGRRASTIGEASSMRRPTCGDDLVDDPAQVRLVVEPDGRLVELALALDPDLAGAVDHDLRDRVVGEQALERPVAEDVVGDLLAETLAVVARQRRLGGRCRRMSTLTRSRSAPGSIATLKSCGPSSPMTARWIGFFSSANGSRFPWPPAVGRSRRSWSSIFLPSSRRGVAVPPVAAGSVAVATAASSIAGRRVVCERDERLGSLGLRAR